MVGANAWMKNRFQMGILWVRIGQVLDVLKKVLNFRVMDTVVEDMVAAD